MLKVNVSCQSYHQLIKKPAVGTFIIQEFYERSFNYASSFLQTAIFTLTYPSGLVVYCHVLCMYMFSIARSSTPEEDENEIGCDDNLDALGDVI